MSFNETVRLWRLERRLTQAELARRTRVPRPNLSAIERGKRDVSLSTLRALAVGLEVRPGVLADGIPPQGTARPVVWSRSTLERLADAVASRQRLRAPEERRIVEWARVLVSSRAHVAQPSARRTRHSPRAADLAWVRLQAACPPEALRSLLERVGDRQRASCSA